MATKPESLRRIHAVQEKMVRLSEWSLAQAEQACRTLAADQVRLRDYAVTEGVLGGALAHAALKSIHNVDRKLAAAERERDEQKLRLNAVRRKEKVALTMARHAETFVRRAQEDRDLEQVMEAWLAADHASLP